MTDAELGDDPAGSTWRDPDVSVAITIGGPRRGISHQIESLLGQECSWSWELVVSVAEGPNDVWVALDALVARHPRVRAVPVSRVGIPAGRNAAIAASTGRFILTCDADDQVCDDWVEQMVQALQTSALVAGRVAILDRGEELAPADDPGPAVAPYDYLPYGLTANLGFHRTLFDRLGGFDEEMRYSDDVDFTWRAQEAGVEMARSPALVVKHRRPTGRGRFVQHLHFGSSDPLLFARHRDQGMARSLGAALRTYGWLLVHLPDLAAPGTRRQWTGTAGRRIGRLIGSIRARAFYP